MTDRSQTVPDERLLDMGEGFLFLGGLLIAGAASVLINTYMGHSFSLVFLVLVVAAVLLYMAWTWKTERIVPLVAGVLLLAMGPFSVALLEGASKQVTGAALLAGWGMSLLYLGASIRYHASS